MISVNTMHVNRWKLYVLITLVFVLILFVFLLFYAKQAKRNEQASKTLEKYQREVLKPLAIDTNFAKDYIKKIDVKLKKIESYIEERGVNLEELKFYGNEKTSNKKAIKTYILYNKKLLEVYRKIQIIPVGYPVKKRITSSYGYRKSPFGRKKTVFHHGIDFDGKSGDPVKTTASGTVALASWNGGYGNCVIVKHDSKYSTLYGHLSKLNVKKGQKINSGHIIGLVGSTGQSTGDHLHYEVHRGTKEYNPKKFLKL